MHIISTAALVARRSLDRVRKKTHDERTLTVYVANGTRNQLAVCGSPLIGAGDLILPFETLSSGQVGVIHFCSQAGFVQDKLSGCHHAGAVEFTLGNERLLVGESLPLGQSLGNTKRFMVEFAGKTAKTIDKFYKNLPQKFLGEDHGLDIVMGIESVARIHAVSTKNPAEVEVILFDDSKCGFELYLNSSQQCLFATWCQSHQPECLKCVLFLIELQGVLSGLGQISPTDKAFALDLLISRFVTHGSVVDLSETLQRYLDEWSVARHNCKLHDFEYSKYSCSDVEEGYVGTLVDAAWIVLRAAGLQCVGKVAEVVAKFQEADGWPGDANGIDVMSFLSGTSSGGTSVRESFGEYTNGNILVEHLRTETEPINATKRPSEGSSASVSQATPRMSSCSRQCSEERIKCMVRTCIQQSAEYAQHMSEIHETFDGLVTACEHRDVVHHRLNHVPLSQRRFTFAGFEETQNVLCKSYSLEALGSLDGGTVTDFKQVLHSLGAASGEYRSMSTNSKSGEFFFFSEDRRFLIKTVSSKEATLLRRMIPAYQNHIAQCPDSMIVRFAGLFHVEVPTLMSQHFVVMLSVFEPSVAIHETFDLKGSLHKRKKREGESIGKDEDWLASGHRLRVSARQRSRLCAVHELDARLLKSFKVMDYSLLVGTHYKSESQTSPANWQKLRGIILSEDEKAVYFLGIIDFLIKYTITKQTENLCRVAQGCGESASCVSQDDYAIRQVSFVRDYVVASLEASADMGTVGQICVFVSSANRLVAADWTGTSDPYVRVTLGLIRRKTHTVRKSCNPKWDCCVYLPVNEDHAKLDIEFTVWDEDKNRAIRGNDDLLGRLTVPMSRVFAGPVDLKNATLLDTKRGELSVKISFAEDQHQ